MIHVDERTKELIVWAARFAAMRLHAEDVRHPIQAHVKRIVEHIQQKPDLSGVSEDEVRKIWADRAQMITQLDYLRVSAVAVATSATLEQAHAASREYGAEGGKEGGDMGGRPSKNTEYNHERLRGMYLALLRDSNHRDARATLVRELQGKTGAKPRAIRNWLTDAGI